MKKNIVTFICCMIYLIVSTKLFRYSLWSSLLPQEHMDDIFYLGIILYGLFCAQGSVSSVFLGGKNLFIIIILPLIAEAFKVLLTGQFNFSEMSDTFALCAGVSVFFILYKHDVSFKVIAVAIICYAFIGFIIQFGENYLGFPALFGGADINEDLNSRYDTIFNILRITVCQQLLPVFCIYFFLSKFIEQKKWVYILPLLVFLVFLYLLQNRQTMVAVVITFVVTPFISNDKNATKYSVISSFLLVVCIYLYSDVLFGALIDSTQNNTESWDIRMGELPFYLKKSIEDPISFLFGHGNQTSPFIVNGMEFWTSDVGFIGQLYQYGIIFVLQYFIILKCAYSNRKLLPLFSKLYIFSSAIHSLFIPPYYTALTAFLWSVILYYSNKEFEENIYSYE